MKSLICLFLPIICTLAFLFISPKLFFLFPSSFPKEFIKFGFSLLGFIIGAAISVIISKKATEKNHER